MKVILVSADPRLLGALCKTVSPAGGRGGCWGMDETHLSVLHSVSNRARGRRSRNSISSRYAFSSFFFFSQTRDCTTSTLQDFYIESVTAHRIKINDHSCFHNSWPNSKIKTKIKTSLRARGPPGVSGALCSLRILRIGRIGSDFGAKQLSVCDSSICSCRE